MRNDGDKMFFLLIQLANLAFVLNRAAVQLEGMINMVTVYSTDG